MYVKVAEIKIYKIMFLRTLATTDMSVRNVRKLKRGNFISLEKRDYHKNVPEVFSNDITPTAYLHIESIPKYEIHCFHKQARRR
jgi:hypothetical protein